MPPRRDIPFSTHETRLGVQELHSVLDEEIENLQVVIGKHPHDRSVVVAHHRVIGPGILK
jgi:hypothetical protein